MQACIPNIGPRQRRRRLLLGVASFAAAVALGSAILSLDDPSLLVRAAVFVPLYGGLLGFLQYRERT